jgi:hypothetical protein
LHLRVYYQQTDGYVYEGAWDQGHGWNSGNTRLFHAKIGTPLAAIVFAVSQPQIRVYYLDNANNIQEYVYSHGWSKGSTLPSTSVFPNTSLAAVTWGNGPQIRIYYQRQDASIQEIVFSSGWSLVHHFSNTTGYLGSGLAAVLINNSPSLRVYYQAKNFALHELAWTGSWSERALNVSLPPRAGIAAVAWLDGSNKPHIRVYFPDSSGHVLELNYNASTGWITPPSRPTNVITRVRAPIAAVEWGSGPVNLRVYFQSTSSNNLTEMVYNGSSWSYHTLGF